MKKKISSPKIKEELDAFILNRQAPFTLDEAAFDLMGKASKKVVQQHLLSNDRIFVDRFEEGLFYPRASFFKGCAFLIQPTKHERELKVLFPGHRFVPFLSMRTFPADTTLYWKGDEPLTKKTVSCPVDDVMIYHTLLGERIAYEYFLLDHEENEWLADPSPSTDKKIQLTVFDMAEVFDAEDFSSNDKLLCTVIDWEDGLYSVEPARGGYEQDTGERIHLWCDELDEALMDGFMEEEGSSLSAHEQLAYAFFTGEGHLSRMPAMHLGGYLNQSDYIEIRHIAGTCLLSPKGDVMPDGPLAFQPPECTGTVEDLDAMMGDVGLSMNSVELRAYMRDALFNNIRDIRKVKERCFAGRTIHFYDARQEAAFTKAIADQWRQVKKDYNLFTDRPYSEMRAKLLAINDAILNHLRKLDRAHVEPQDLSEESIMELGELSGIVAATLNMLDEPDEDKEDIDQLAKSIDQLWGPLQEITQRACDELKAKGYELTDL